MSRASEAVEYFTGVVRDGREQLQQFHTRFYQSVRFNLLVLLLCPAVRATAAEKALSSEHSARAWRISSAQPIERTQNLRSFFAYNIFRRENGHCRPPNCCQCRRQGNDRHIARAFDLFGGRITAPWSDLAIARVDRIDRTLEAVTRERIDGLAAGARGIGARADDGDAAWVEQALEWRHESNRRIDGEALDYRRAAVPGKARR